MAKNSFVAEVTLKWANKKCKNFNIYNAVFLKKLRKTIKSYNYFTAMYKKSWWSIFSKNQNFEKMKKIAGDIILYKFTKNHNHMRYGSLDRIFSHFGPFLPKFGKNVKKPWDVILLHICNIKEDMMYGSWDVRHYGQSFL